MVRGLSAAPRAYGVYLVESVSEPLALAGTCRLWLGDVDGRSTSGSEPVVRPWRIFISTWSRIFREIFIQLASFSSAYEA